MDFKRDLPVLAGIYSNRRWRRLTTIGHRACRDTYFFKKLEQGRVTIRSAERVWRWFGDNWPDDIEWPSGIERPGGA
ncbi:MAG: hypothetical protein OXN96_19140 [Bryobacterales bacterium]|nr:hypothetical protein [Bryobacterales bacterium]